MHLSFHLQLKGYWLGFFAWLILTFAPFATALTQTELGYLRLCSSMGAVWVQTTPDSAGTNQNACTCLTTAIATATNELPNIEHRAFYQAKVTLSSRPFEVSLSAQPRAPPFSF
ncbi:hypothetical protein [Reinekea sp.]|jgi:hypothetical protein|uniref:hypothetical protein n=1 Tax=Reinekea sp. TaxID=1970455 RepID=UPI003989F0F2